MRTMPHDHRALGNVLPSHDRLSAYRALPHLDVLPATATEAPGVEVRLLDDALNLPDGSYLTVSMVHSRLSRPSVLRVDLLDRAGRRRPTDSLYLEPLHAEAFRQAVQRFTEVAETPATATARRHA